MIRVALLGNPNSGKTTLFNALTGSTAHVGNWPGVTVDKKDGVYKKCEQPITVIDLPGIYSLSPYTPEEIITRNYIVDEKPDCVINIIDATNLERNLYLATQALEADVPVVLALNMSDLVKKNGDVIDVKALSDKMGVPAVEISALRGEGIDDLMKVVYAQSQKPRKGVSVLESCPLSPLMDDLTAKLKDAEVASPLFHAVKIIENDRFEVENHPEYKKTVDEFKTSYTSDVFGTDYEAMIADARYQWITGDIDKIWKKVDKKAETKSDKIDKVLTNKWAGIPIFLVVLFAVFHLTFSENLFFLGGILPENFLLLEGTAFEGVFGGGAIYSPGVILFNLLDLLTATIGEVIAGWMADAGWALWVQDFINNGVLAGVFGVLSFLPQILLLFLFFSILEDWGYMARVAFLLDRMFRKFGLSGRAIMPMIMGFGCSVPAMINTRTLADQKERTATIRVIPFFSCGAKLPILTAIAGAIIGMSSIPSPDLIVYGMYVIGIAVAIVAIIAMRGTTMRGEISPLIMELPAYHAVQFKNLMIHLWDKAKHFVQKAFTIIVASSIVIWFLSSFSWNYTFLPAEVEGELVNLRMDESILGSIGMIIQPIFTPLGFGSQLSAEWGWVFAVAAITGLIAKENVISTFGTLAACIVGTIIASEEGVDEVSEMITATKIEVPGLLAYIAFNMTTIPCFAAVATAKAELGKSTFNWTLVFWLVASFLSGSAVYTIATWWWTAFIWVAVFALAVVLIRLYNKKHPLKN